jgi:membrane associated rhomboid family serine protease
VIPPAAGPARAPQETLPEGVVDDDGLPPPAPVRPPAPPFVLVTWALVAFLGGIFALEMLWGQASSPTLVRMGANVVERTRSGEVDRILSATTLHVAPWHALMNLYVLWALGRQLEPLLGRSPFALLYFASAVGGGIGTTLLGGEGIVSAGASGAIWGLLGASAMLAFRPPKTMPAHLVAAARRSATTNLLINVGISFLPGIDRWAHFGGGAVGAFLVGVGILVPPRFAKVNGDAPEPGLHVASLWLVSAVLALATVASIGVSWSRGRPWALAGPPVLVERTLRSGLTVSVPAELVEQDTGVVGELNSDPLVIQVLEDGPTMGTPDTLTAEAVSALSSLTLPNMSPVGSPVATTIPAGILVARAFTSENGFAMQRMVVIGPRRTVVLDVGGWSALLDVPAAAAAIAASIRL